jgi:hypothetical protein
VQLLRERDKAARHPVQRFDRAGLDVIDPAVQDETAAFERQRDRRVCLEVGNLGNHVCADHGIDAVPLAGMFPCFIDGLGRIRITQPARHTAGMPSRHLQAAMVVLAPQELKYIQEIQELLEDGGPASEDLSFILHERGLIFAP